MQSVPSVNYGQEHAGLISLLGLERECERIRYRYLELHGYLLHEQTGSSNREVLGLDKVYKPINILSRRKIHEHDTKPMKGLHAS